MKVFSFDPTEYRELYDSQQWVYIPGGITPEFLEVLRAFVATSFGARKVEGRAIAGAKDQAIFEFPDAVDVGEVFDVAAELGGLNRPTITLSERHVKAYFGDAAPEPTAHKDRYSSQISIGLSIDIPADSRVILYPDDDRAVNPFNVSGALIGSLPVERHPDSTLRDAREVEVDDQPGDVVAFPGSSVWHLRRQPAGAVILYLKLNDFNSDPLGEDPATSERREATLAALAAGDGAIDDCVPVLSRRIDTITRRYLRDRWEEVIEADVWERSPQPLCKWDLSLLRATDGERTAAALLKKVGPPPEGSSGEHRLRELAELEIIDLLPAGEA